jgi:hypothetical protein
VTEAALDAYRIVDVQCTPASWTAYGAGCAAGASAPALLPVGLPVLGGTLSVGVAGLGAGVPVMLAGVAAENLPLPLPELAPGCTLLTRIDIAVVLAPSGGNALWWLAIPNAPAVQGARIHHQAVEFGTPWTMSGGGVAEVH